MTATVTATTIEIDSGEGEESCPLTWAQEANAVACSTVFDFAGEVPEVCEGAYFSNAVTAIDTQIAKQGLRLAAWLNMLFDGTAL
ncbi:hypothetical protein NM688_g7098 [Phlebia brevispora]|uniref:Uncharacterized protein n=1 Tax=Phlebia brevispora TaxID=194682 RepID=A0ACC1S929_9APHY|nr:hypothetical protein NM688_g7098 [Phlebia brevispora]